jgi:hypothetical protein
LPVVAQTSVLPSAVRPVAPTGAHGWPRATLPLGVADDEDEAVDGGAGPGLDDVAGAAEGAAGAVEGAAGGAGGTGATRATGSGVAGAAGAPATGGEGAGAGIGAAVELGVDRRLGSADVGVVVGVGVVVDSADFEPASCPDSPDGVGVPWLGDISTTYRRQAAYQSVATSCWAVASGTVPAQTRSCNRTASAFLRSAMSALTGIGHKFAALLSPPISTGTAWSSRNRSCAVG